MLASANHRVPVDRLVHDIWDGALGDVAAPTLASHVSLLRELIGAERIADHEGSYCINIGKGELDALEFESAVADGRESFRGGDLRRAVDCFERGLRYWRGPALADVAGASWAHGEAARLEEHRLTGEELLLDARMGLGLHREVVGSAEAAVDRRGACGASAGRRSGGSGRSATLALTREVPPSPQPVNTLISPSVWNQ